MDDWIRLPKDQEKCPYTGLSRSTLNEILTETDPLTGEKLVKSLVKIKPGAKRGIKLINLESVLDYLEKEAKRQSGLRFAVHIINPEGLSIDQVLEDRETYNNFLNPDLEITFEAWENGHFSTRRKRLMVLFDTGVVVKDRPPAVDDED